MMTGFICNLSSICSTLLWIFAFCSFISVDLLFFCFDFDTALSLSTAKYFFYEYNIQKKEMKNIKKKQITT